MSEEKATLKEGEFVLGVLDAFSVPDNDDVVVIGRVQGIIRDGDRLYISNIGDDDDELVILHAVALEVDRKVVPIAKDELVAIKIGDAKGENIKVGTVIRSENVDESLLKTAYVNALADSYVGKRKMELNDITLVKMSIADCAETWRVYSWIFAQNKDVNSEADVAIYKSNLRTLGTNIAKKVLLADEIYCVFGKMTDEPFLFSKTFNKDQGFVCTPPMIKIFPKAYLKEAKEKYDTDKTEVRKIENGEDMLGIEKFLSEAFCMTGALGVMVIFDQTEIGSQAFINEMKDEKSKSPVGISNPDISRWLLLSLQIGKPETEEDKMVSRMYFNLFARELPKARLLVPMKHDKDLPRPGKDETITFNEKIELSLPVRMDTNGRQSLCLYTDINKMRKMYDKEWDILVQPIEAFVNQFDCIIDHIDNKMLGCVVTKESYETIKKIAEKGNGE